MDGSDCSHDAQTYEDDVNLPEWISSALLESNSSVDTSEIDNVNVSSSVISENDMSAIPSGSSDLVDSSVYTGCSLYASSTNAAELKNPIGSAEYDTGLKTIKDETPEQDVPANDELNDYVIPNQSENTTTENSDNDCYVVASFKQTTLLQNKKHKSNKRGNHHPVIEYVDLTEDEPEETNYQDAFVNTFTKDTRLCILLDVIPDADPDFLRRKVHEIKTDDELQLFVVAALETQNYPKLVRDTNQKLGEIIESDFSLKDLSVSVVSSTSHQSTVNNSQADNLGFINLSHLSSDAVPVQEPLTLTSFTRTVMSGSAARTIPTHVPSYTNTPFAASLMESPTQSHSRPVISVTPVPQPSMINAKPHTVTSQEISYSLPPRGMPQPISSTSYTDVGLSQFPGITVDVATPPQETNKELATNIAAYIPLHTAVTSTQTDEASDQPLNLTVTAAKPPVALNTPLKWMPPDVHFPRATWINSTTPPGHRFPRRDVLYPNAHVWIPCQLQMNVSSPRRDPVYKERRLFYQEHRRRRRLGLLDAATQLDNNILMEDILDALTGPVKPKEVKDQRYKLLADVLIWADPEFLRNEVKKLKNNDDVEKFLIRAIANEEIWSKCVTAEDPARKIMPELSDCKYKILLELLPDASPTFLKRESAKLKSDKEVHEFAMKLSREQTYPKRKSPGNSHKSNKRKQSEMSDPEPIDPKYQALIDMLPDADPDFLFHECKTLGNDDDLQAFVIKAVEENTYPKREQFLERQEFHKQWKRYIENFDIKEFLLVIPNPVKFFYIDKVNSKNPLDIPGKFLQHRYRRKCNHDFAVSYNVAKHSLTKTCDVLDLHFQVKPRKYGAWDQKSIFSTSVLQEIAFIQNKKEIAHYLLFKDKKRTEAYEKAKTEGTLQECNCCYDENLSEDMACCGVGHLFCLNCIKRGSEVVIGNGGTKFPCYSDGCKEEFSFDVLKNVLNPEVFSRLLIRKQYEEVNAAGILGLETCSFCEFCFIPPAEDKLFHCLNPSCMKITCRSCKKLDHLPLSCEEFMHKETQKKMQSYVEDKMTEALVRTCWQCGTKFVKESGCNMMQCKCGAKMCYYCRQPVQDYHHFASGRCGKFLDTTAQDEAAVIDVGKKAKLEVEAANPGYSLPSDPTLLRNKLHKHKISHRYVI